MLGSKYKFNKVFAGIITRRESERLLEVDKLPELSRRFSLTLVGRLMKEKRFFIGVCPVKRMN